MRNILGILMCVGFATLVGWPICCHDAGHAANLAKARAGVKRVGLRPPMLLLLLLCYCCASRPKLILAAKPICLHGDHDLNAAYLGRGHHGVGVHDAIRILFAYLRDEQCAQAGASAAAQRVGQLEALQTVAALRFLAQHLQH